MSRIALILNDQRGLQAASLLTKGGYQVVCVDNRHQHQAAIHPLPDSVQVVQSVTEALKQAQTVLTILDSQQQDEDIYLAGGGILAAAHSESLFIDFSSISPRMARELNALATVHDHAFVEAGLLGSPDKETGNWPQVLAASEPGILKRARPILAVLATEIIETGLAGTAMTAKLAVQIALAGSLMGLAEALAFANQNSLEKTTLVNLLASDNSPITNIAAAFGPAIIAEDFTSGPPIRNFLDDLSLALESADEASLPLPGLETVQQLYDLLQLIGDDRRGIQSLILAYYDEKNSERFGLNWSLAQKAMDVYERSSENLSDDDDDYDDDDFEHSHSTAHSHEHDAPPEGFGFDPYSSGPGTEGQKPSTGSFFSDN
ncbi:MAG: NAD(P)-dependent oxidoreductase [Coriobacteriales bacterium]|nr:NAD(P)-dependent oxidoreductase [Coriobacteriales bacterium]